MKLTWGAAAFLAWVTGPCAPAVLVYSAESSSGMSDPAIELPPFRVLADMLTITFRADPQGTVVESEVTQVTPNSPAAQRDIEIHDELVAINHDPVAGASYEKMTALIDQELKPGTVLTLSFTGNRGVFHQRRIKYDFVIMRPAAKAGASGKTEPNQH